MALALALQACAITSNTRRAEVLIEWRAQFSYEETGTREPQPARYPEQQPTP